jgi:hypothetical protein
MEAINTLPNMTRAKSKAFNRVRLHFGVAHLSELTTADGTAISRDAWDGTRQRLSPLLWPFQPKPGPKSFRTWRRLLATSFLQGHRARVSVRTRDLTLRTALGHWRPCSEGFRYQWTSFFSPQENLLYCVSEQGDTFDIHSALRVRRRPKHPVRAFGNDPTASNHNIKVGHSMVCFSSSTRTKSTLYVSFCLSWTMVRGLWQLPWVLMCENESFYPTSLSH